ncbi:MAG: shikimate dehydrogenase [Chloroflexi bacterium]|nr:shikimate dehydrogenase [Chloroflexota bacterium]
MEKIFGVMGHPIGHTRSPVFQQAALDHSGIDVTFQTWDVAPEDLAARVESFRVPEFMGCCVTLPHKQTIMPLVDRLADTAEAVGAVNWVLPEDGKLVGHNTDAPGFLRALRESAGFDPAGANAVVFGSGGAARAIVYALKTGGAATVSIANRTVEKAQALAREMTDGKFRPNAIGLDPTSLADVVPYASLLVNTTSMGMEGGPAPDATPVTAELISADATCYDAVYAPPMTPFLLEAERAGATPAGGISMLVYQGVVGFELATGKKAPVEVMFAALAAAR